MSFDTLDDEAGGEVTPSQIAQNDLFTAREKIEMLNQLKADALAAGEEGLEPGFSPDEIDAAIAEVRQDAEDGGTEALSRGGL